MTQELYTGIESQTKQEPLKFGFPNKTIIIDSQSAPPLRGVVSEQVYKRMYLMGKKEDIVLHEAHYPIDSNYLDYLKNTLGLELPIFQAVPTGNSGTLVGDILQSEDTIDSLKYFKNIGYKFQFFNLTSDLEKPLIDKVGNASYSENFDGVLKIGEKTGFREFSEKHGIPIPKGIVAKSKQELIGAIEPNKSYMLKAKNGTAGAELGSNAEVTKEEIAGYKQEGILESLMDIKTKQLSPSTYPMVIEEKLPYKDEGSIHVFINNDGQLIIEPTVFGQVAEHGSYKGGFFPNSLKPEFEKKILDFANSKLVPALKSEKLTGFHCFDFMYDESLGDFKLIEDNTRPGALDFLHHFVTRICEANGIKDFTWYSKNFSLSKMGIDATSFTKVKNILGDFMDPNSAISKQLGAFALVSNPDVLPHGGDLSLTIVMQGGKNGHLEKMQDFYSFLLNQIKHGSKHN